MLPTTSGCRPGRSTSRCRSIGHPTSSTSAPGAATVDGTVTVREGEGAHREAPPRTAAFASRRRPRKMTVAPAADRPTPIIATSRLNISALAVGGAGASRASSPAASWWARRQHFLAPRIATPPGVTGPRRVARQDLGSWAGRVRLSGAVGYSAPISVDVTSRRRGQPEQDRARLT